jgi:hypothetical protein
MSNQKTEVNVELCGGVFDGHLTTVDLAGNAEKVWLFRDKETDAVCAYEMRGRTLRGGKVWALDFLQVVGRCGVEGGAA